MPTYDKRLPDGELVKVEEERDNGGVVGYQKIHRADGSIETNITPRTAHFHMDVKARELEQ
jgi:hypothetical protein